jgi:hypothetical protein
MADEPAKPERRAWRPLARGAAAVVLAVIEIVGAVVDSQNAGSSKSQGSDTADSRDAKDSGDAGAASDEDAGVVVFHIVKIDLKGLVAKVSGGSVNPQCDYKLQYVFEHNKSHEMRLCKGISS